LNLRLPAPKVTRLIFNPLKHKKIRESVFRWLQLDEFQRAYKAARRKVIDQAIAQIQSVLSEAVRTLLSVMSDDAAPASAKVSAARALLDIGFKVAEIEDLESRIEKIERNL